MVLEEGKFSLPDHEDAGSGALEGTALAAARRSAVEADIVGSESRCEFGGVEDGSVQVGDFEKEVAGALFPIDREETVELLQTGGALLDRRDACRLSGGATSGLLGVERDD